MKKAVFGIVSVAALIFVMNANPAVSGVAIDNRDCNQALVDGLLLRSNAPDAAKNNAFISAHTNAGNPDGEENVSIALAKGIVECENFENIVDQEFQNGNGLNPGLISGTTFGSDPGNSPKQSPD